MKDIYLTSTFTNEWNMAFNPKIGEALERKGIKCHLPRKNINQERTDGDVFIQDIEGINNSSMILAIGLNETPNWGAEIGYAYGIKKTVIALTDKEHNIPVICKGMLNEVIRVENLDLIDEYIELLVNKIKDFIK